MKKIIPNTLSIKYNGIKGLVKYFGRKNISVSFSPSLKKIKMWKSLKRGVLAPREGYFDNKDLYALNPILSKEGILLVYFTKNPISLGLALFSDKRPEQLLWRSANPLWESKEKIHPVGVRMKDGSLTVYFEARDGKMGRITFSIKSIFGGEPIKLGLERVEENPILKAAPENSWESQYVFNPAAIYLDGRVHLIYRAIGNNGMSVLGYASSKDGVNIDERLDKPIYTPTQPFEYRSYASKNTSYHFASGGGWGGCEDPRITRIDDVLYMTYVAFNGHEPPRVALTSIKVKDFLAKKWKWKKPVLISPPKEMHKNWVVFPKKINDKFAILHSICPDILIADLDNLDFDGNAHIKSRYISGGRKDSWDNWVRGAASPPIETEEGWLLLYHAMDTRDPGRYKIGAMVLDFENPYKILHRSERPILQPDEHYENEGFKSGVVYACGSVVIDGTLYVYYGGADTVVCVATANLKDFLNELKVVESPKFEWFKCPRKNKLKAIFG
jgi:predicted GH43/DUF377 family glycosyl hydrolase